MVRRLLGMLAGPQPDDRALRWRGTAAPGRPVVRVAHYGDCGWREMPRSHGIHTPPGWPRALAGALEREGAGMEFSSWVVHDLKWLPGPDQLDAHLRLTGDPDVVIVQLGALHSRLVVLPDTAELLRLRARIARRLGRRVFAGYRVLRPFVSAFGRFVAPYEGTRPLVAFLLAVRRRWPGSHVVVLLPYPRAAGARRQHAIQERVRADVRAAAEEAGTPWLDVAAEIGPDRCANGYNLGRESSARVGLRLARELALTRRGPASARAPRAGRSRPVPSP